ncbi:hypothetical protein EJ591_23350, partial [Pseudomonas aeruginosa]
KQLNTWVSFQSAEQPLLGQFSVSGNRHALSFRRGTQTCRYGIGGKTERLLATHIRPCGIGIAWRSGSDHLFRGSDACVL